MKTRAVSMVLLMIASALAGCTAGDPDGDGDMGIDAELLDQLIQENLQDFINNTTVTVNNYHSSNETHYTYNTYNGSSDYVQQIIVAGTSPGVSTTQGDTSNQTDMVILVRNDRYHENTAGGSWGGLDGANICVQIGSNTEGRMQNAFSNVNIAFTSIPIADIAEGTAKFIDGSCDAMTGSRNVIDLKQEQLENDGSMNGVAIWITDAYASGAEYFAVQSQFEYTITQEYGEEINFGEAHLEVTLTGTCVQNCTSEDEDTSLVFVFDNSYYSGSPPYDMISDCDIEGYGELNYYNYSGFYFLPGLNCTTTIYVHAHIWLENPNYEYTWSDWAYYIAWTETEVTMED